MANYDDFTMKLIINENETEKIRTVIDAVAYDGGATQLVDLYKELQLSNVIADDFKDADCHHLSCLAFLLTDDLEIAIKASNAAFRSFISGCRQIDGGLEIYGYGQEGAPEAFCQTLFESSPCLQSYEVKFDDIEEEYEEEYEEGYDFH